MSKLFSSHSHACKNLCNSLTDGAINNISSDTLPQKTEESVNKKQECRQNKLQIMHCQ